MKKVLSLLFVSFAFMATSFAQKQTSKAAAVRQKFNVTTQKTEADKMAKQKLAEEKKKQQGEQKKSSSEEAALSNAAPAAGTKQKK
jgi:Ni/Co efflux regulator RcnB